MSKFFLYKIKIVYTFLKYLYLLVWIFVDKTRLLCARADWLWFQRIKNIQFGYWTQQEFLINSPVYRIYIKAEIIDIEILNISSIFQIIHNMYYFSNYM